MKKVCEWKAIDEGQMGIKSWVWITSCNADFDLEWISPRRQNVNYCPKCGGKIKIINNER